MNRQINDSDIFKLVQSHHLNVEHYQILLMLYQPILGVNSINLYLTLVQEKVLTKRINLDFNHGRIKLLLNITTTAILTAFQQLESANLINTYYYSLKSTYIYELNLPLSANEFFINETLNTLLLNQLGSLNYERQKFYFLKNEIAITDDYLNISQKDIPLTPPLNNHDNDQQYAFTLPNILSSLSTQFSTNALKVNLQTQPIISTKEAPAVINSTLALMQQKHPVEYLTTLTQKNLSEKLKSTLTLLINDYHLNNSVINCLMEYVWFKNNKRLEPNYIIKIAQTFQENKIDNIEDALKHLKLAYAKGKKNPQQKYQQETLWTSQPEILPTKEFIKINEEVTPPENQNVVLMTKEEIDQILKEIDDY